MLNSRLQGWTLGIGRTATCCADQILEITLIWVVWQATHSSTMTGIAAFVQRAPFWILGYAGAKYVDIVGARRMLFLLNISAVAVALIAALALQLSNADAVILTVMGFCIGTVRSMEAPSLTSLVPKYTGVWSVQGLNNLLDNAKRVGRLAAPFPALLLGKIPLLVLVALPCIGYAAMAAISRSLGRSSSREFSSARHFSALHAEDFLSSAARIYRSGKIGLILGASALYATLHGAAYFSVMPRVLLVEDGGAVGSYASVVGAFASGAILSNLIIARVHISRFASSIAIGMLMAGISFSLIGQTDNVWLRWTIGFIGGMSLPFQDVFITCLIQQDAPKEMLARTHALWRLGCEAGIGLGMIVGGIASDVYDGASLLIVIGACIAMVAVSVLVVGRKS